MRVDSWWLVLGGWCWGWVVGDGCWGWVEFYVGATMSHVSGDVLDTEGLALSI